jgi:hypothetical protein
MFTYTHRMTATQSPVEGKLLSDVYGGNYPGSISYNKMTEDTGKYSYGKIQGGLQPHTGPVDLADIPVIKACSDYPGGDTCVCVCNG